MKYGLLREIENERRRLSILGGEKGQIEECSPNFFLIKKTYFKKSYKYFDTIIQSQQFSITEAFSKDVLMILKRCFLTKKIVKAPTMASNPMM